MEVNKYMWTVQGGSPRPRSWCRIVLPGVSWSCVLCSAPFGWDSCLLAHVVPLYRVPGDSCQSGRSSYPKSKAQLQPAFAAYACSCIEEMRKQYFKLQKLIFHFFEGKDFGTVRSIFVLGSSCQWSNSCVLCSIPVKGHLGEHIVYKEWQRC